MSLLLDHACNALVCSPTTSTSWHELAHAVTTARVGVWGSRHDGAVVKALLVVLLRKEEEEERTSHDDNMMDDDKDEGVATNALQVQKVRTRNDNDLNDKDEATAAANALRVQKEQTSNDNRTDDNNVDDAAANALQVLRVQLGFQPKLEVMANIVVSSTQTSTKLLHVVLDMMVVVVTNEIPKKVFAACVETFLVPLLHLRARDNNPPDVVAKIETIIEHSLFPQTGQDVFVKLCEPARTSLVSNSHLTTAPRDVSWMNRLLDKLDDLLLTNHIPSTDVLAFLCQAAKRAYPDMESSIFAFTLLDRATKACAWDAIVSLLCVGGWYSPTGMDFIALKNWFEHITSTLRDADQIISMVRAVMIHLDHRCVSDDMVKSLLSTTPSRELLYVTLEAFSKSRRLAVWFDIVTNMTMTTTTSDGSMALAAVSFSDFLSLHHNLVHACSHIALNTQQQDEVWKIFFQQKWCGCDFQSIFLATFEAVLVNAQVRMTDAEHVKELAQHAFDVIHRLLGDNNNRTETHLLLSLTRAMFFFNDLYKMCVFQSAQQHDDNLITWDMLIHAPVPILSAYGAVSLHGSVEMQRWGFDELMRSDHVNEMFMKHVLGYCSTVLDMDRWCIVWKRIIAEQMVTVLQLASLYESELSRDAAEHVLQKVLSVISPTDKKPRKQQRRAIFALQILAQFPATFLSPTFVQTSAAGLVRTWLERDDVTDGAIMVAAAAATVSLVRQNPKSYRVFTMDGHVVARVCEMIMQDGGVQNAANFFIVAAAAAGSASGSENIQPIIQNTMGKTNMSTLGICVLNTLAALPRCTTWQSNVGMQLLQVLGDEDWATSAAKLDFICSVQAQLTPQLEKLLNMVGHPTAIKQHLVPVLCKGDGGGAHTLLKTICKRFHVLERQGRMDPTCLPLLCACALYCVEVWGNDDAWRALLDNLDENDSPRIRDLISSVTSAKGLWVAAIVLKQRKLFSCLNTVLATVRSCPHDVAQRLRGGNRDATSVVMVLETIMCVVSCPETKLKRADVSFILALLVELSPPEGTLGNAQALGTRASIVRCLLDLHGDVTNKMSAGICAVLRGLLTHFVVAVGGNDDAIIHNAGGELIRAHVSLVKYSDVYRHHVVSLLSHYMTLCHFSKISQHIRKDVMEPLGFAMLDLCESRDEIFQQLHAILGGGVGGARREMMRTLREAYERGHKYKGE